MTAFSLRARMSRSAQVGRVRHWLHKDDDLVASMWKLALPAAGEQGLGLIVGLVDTFLVGHLSSAALTAVGIANQWVMLITTFLMAVSIGTTALVARATGARDNALSQRVLRQSLLLGFLLGVLGSVALSVWYAPAVALLGTPATAVASAHTYLRVVAVVFPIWSMMILGNAALRGAGDTTTPLLVMVVVNVVNIGVAWVLIRGVAGFPRLGVLGAALGDMSGRLVGGLLVLAWLVKGRSGLKLAVVRPRFDFGMAKRIFKIGLPTGLERFSFRIAMMVFSSIIASLGTVAYAAHQVAFNGESLSYMPGFGFAVAASTLVGQSLGAKRPDRARKSGYLTYKMAAALMTFMGVIFIFFAGDIIAVFTNDPQVIATGTMPLRLVGITQPLLAAMMVFSSGLRGAGDTRPPMLINGISPWVVRLPLAYLLAIQLGWGLNGAWVAMMVDMSLRGILNYFRFRSGKWAFVEV